MFNLLLIFVIDVDFIWNQIIDMVDDYFDIVYELWVCEIGGVLIEGWIET